MLRDRLRRDQQLIERRVRARRLVGKIAAHGGERQEDFVHVPAVVAGVLLLFRHHADDGVRKIVQIDRVADRIASGK